MMSRGKERSNRDFRGLVRHGNTGCVILVRPSRNQASSSTGFPRTKKQHGTTIDGSRSGLGTPSIRRKELLAPIIFLIFVIERTGSRREQREILAIPMQRGPSSDRQREMESGREGEKEKKRGRNDSVAL